MTGPGVMADPPRRVVPGISRPVDPLDAALAGEPRQGIHKLPADTLAAPTLGDEDVLDEEGILTDRHRIDLHEGEQSDADAVAVGDEDLDAGGVRSRSVRGAEQVEADGFGHHPSRCRRLDAVEGEQLSAEACDRIGVCGGGPPNAQRWPGPTNHERPRNGQATCPPAAQELAASGPRTLRLA